MDKSALYERCCNQRLQDLIRWVSAVYPGQTITRDYVMKNATLESIAKSSAATQRIINWAMNAIKGGKV